MARHTIDNTDDVIDSRDVISRLEELRDERGSLTDAIDEWDDEKGLLLKDLQDNDERNDEEEDQMNNLVDERASLVEELGDWDNDNEEELKALEALNEEGENATGEWRHGETLIREDHFKSYVEQLCEDIGDLPRNMPSYIVIDWEATARNLEADYTDIDFDGVTYKIRCC